MRLSMIVAASTNNVIGINGQLPWNLPKDLQYFKRITNHHPIVMGRKTMEALGKPLPNRTHIVITRNGDYKMDGVNVVDTPEKALALAKTLHNDEVFIIGGGEIFHQMLPLTDRVYLTRVHSIVQGDAHFPVLHHNEWHITSSESHEVDEKHNHTFTFEVFDRIKTV